MFPAEQYILANANTINLSILLQLKLEAIELEAIDKKKQLNSIGLSFKGCVKMKLVEFVTFKLIVNAFFNKVIRLGLVFHWLSTKSPTIRDRTTIEITVKG